MNQQVLTVTTCPTCSSPRIERVCGKWRASYKGESYEVAELEYYSCPDCGEKVYPPEAMRKIQERSPAYPGRSDRRQGRDLPNPTARVGN